MHRRIRERRLTIGRPTRSAADDTAAQRINRDLAALEERLALLHSQIADERLADLFVAARSARKVAELCQASDQPLPDLMPCALAALKHVRNALLGIAAELTSPSPHAGNAAGEPATA